MKILQGILLEISESDLDAKGHFYNAEITSIANTVPLRCPPKQVLSHLLA